MPSFPKARWTPGGFFIIGAVIVAACNLTVAPDAPPANEPPPNLQTDLGDVQPEMVFSAPILRATLNTLLGEQVFLAVNATDAALHNREAEFTAAADTLDKNSQDLAALIGLVYGEAIHMEFLPLWRKHISFLVDYTRALAQADETARAQALENLTTYAADLGAFLATANPHLTQKAVQDLLGPHVKTLTAAIDAQAKDDYPTAYLYLRQSYGHMDMIATTLANAINQQFPERFPGAVASQGSNLRSTLNQLLAEHVVLAAMTTNAALGGRTAEVAAAAETLHSNSVDLAAAVGSVYGAEAGDAFLALWSKHIGLLEDYAAATDAATRIKVLNDLALYTDDLGAFLVAANPNLTKQAINSLLSPHVNALTALIDAQAAGNPVEAFMHLRAAYVQMRMIANPLSDAIIIQFPATYSDVMLDARMVQGVAMADTPMPPTPFITTTLPLSDSPVLITSVPMTPSRVMTVSLAITETRPVTTSIALTEARLLSETTPLEQSQSTVIMSAPRLRAMLARLLGEHVGLAASASDAALRGRSAEFNVAATALANNSVDLASVIGLVYGKAPQAAFLSLWTTHIGFLVDYTSAVATGDEAARSQALVALDRYAEDFGAFLQTANADLPADAFAALLRTHVATLTSVIDAQGIKTIHASGDQIRAYPALRTAFAHMDLEATALAGGIAKQFPDKFPGAVDTPAAALRTTLTQLLSEHALLLIKAMDAAVHARNIEYEAAFAALNENSVALANAIGSLYGDDVGKTFLGLWRKHVGLFADYALALIDNNINAQQKAAQELTQVAQDLAAFFNTTNPDLPPDRVTDLMTEHVNTTLAALDASATDHPEMYYSALRTAYSHMGMIANRLSDALITQFPAQLGGEDLSASAGHSMADMAAPAEKTAIEKPPDSTTFAVAITAFSFQPARLEIPVGSKVIWTNQDAIDHTVTSGAPGAETRFLDSGFFDQAEQFAVTFGAAGEYAYFCQRHNSMRGVIVVK